MIVVLVATKCNPIPPSQFQRQIHRVVILVFLLSLLCFPLLLFRRSVPNFYLDGREGENVEYNLQSMVFVLVVLDDDDDDDDDDDPVEEKENDSLRQTLHTTHVHYFRVVGEAASSSSIRES